MPTVRVALFAACRERDIREREGGVESTDRIDLILSDCIGAGEDVSVPKVRSVSGGRGGGGGGGHMLMVFCTSRMSAVILEMSLFCLAARGHRAKRKERRTEQTDGGDDVHDAVGVHGAE
jgi:hypothetical protein